MARLYAKRRSDPPIKVQGSRGFPLGLNELTHPSAIKNNELAECKNAVFDQNGVIKKRQGSKLVGTSRDVTNSKIIGLQGVYDIGGQDFMIRVADDGIAQKYDETTETWTDIASSPTFTNKRTYILQGYGYVYFMNESDVLRKWDGTTWTTYTTIANPTTAPTAAKVGTGTGPRTYYYKYVYFNEIGYTMASNAGSVASMPDTLDTSTYITVTMPGAAPAGTVSVGIFRGVEPGEERYLSKVPAAQLVYMDKGQDETDETYSVPSGNTTSGYHFKIAAVYKDTILGITTEFGDDTIVYSGGLDAFDTFAISEGGGFREWRKGDGSGITCLKPFKEELYVFKTNKIGAFKFDTSTGGVTIRDINLAIGAVSQDAVHEAGNDLRGYAYEGAFSLGNEPNFADVIRSKLLSPRVQKSVDSVTRQDITGIVSTYFKNLSIWSIPMASVGDGNSAMLVYDERYAAWSLWTGIKAGIFTKFIDQNKEEHLYYGSAVSGNVSEMFTGTNDNGVAISFRIATKQFDMGVPYKYKTYNRCYLLFGLVTGASTTITMMSDTNDLVGAYPLYINSDAVGFGTDQWGTEEFGETGDMTVDVAAGIIIRFIDLSNKDYFNIQTIIDNNGLNDQLEIMGIFFEYSESERPLSSANRLSKI